MRRKLIIAGLMAATLAPAAAWAEPPRAHREDIRDARGDIREERRELREARRDGDRRDIREERHDVRDAQRDLRREQNDARGDWRAYRERDRNAYRMPAYVGPRGYSYRAVNRGYRLPNGYYAQRYWIADPYRYRLPRASGRDRWVRYGNDVLLVDTRNGQVQDVIRNFFW
jgi:Ni/Co efflux regulator RcnB